MKIDVAIPTYGGQNIIGKTLDCLQTAINNSGFEINTIHVDYKRCDDVTDDVIHSHTEFDTVIHETNHNLPEAREYLISQIDTRWFLFLDDDVRLHENTLLEMEIAISPPIGAIQVAKTNELDTPNSWSKWRPVRGTTFATLVRTHTVKDIEIPSEITQLEDEYIRKYIENKEGFLWIFDHRAKISHDNQDRHSIGWTEGYLAGKYELLPYHYVFLNVPYNIITLGNPLKHTARAIGYCYGKIQ